MAIDVKLEKFEGPLDLLLHLIDKNKIDIYDIPISEITDQYLEYVQAMDHEDMDVTSEFMVMAATLIDIKCRMLLPKEVNEEGEEEDPREELVRALLEHKQYRCMAEKLRVYMEETGNRVTRDQQFPKEVLAWRPPVDTEELLADVTMQKLEEIFRFVLKRQENKIDPIRSRFGHIEKEDVTLPEKIAFVKKAARKKRHMTFRGLLEAQNSKMQTIMTFLAVLELMKTGQIRISQNELFGEIEINAVEGADLSDPAEADRENAGDHADLYIEGAADGRTEAAG
ncbi:MAG: segregation/condensation protein A [Eubacterium sp.]|nr:segregation/condensation protein A [Eubacterium sp.]